MSYLETSLPGMKSWASLSLKLACALLGIELPQREKGQTGFRCVPGPTPKHWKDASLDQRAERVADTRP